MNINCLIRRLLQKATCQLANGAKLTASAHIYNHCCPKQILQLIKMLSKIRHRLIALELGLFYQAAAHKVHLANAVNPCV